MMNDEKTIGENYHDFGLSPAERIQRLTQRIPQPPQQEEQVDTTAFEEAIRADVSDINERHANAVNAVLHAKGILATVTPDEAASIWLIANALDTVSG